MSFRQILTQKLHRLGYLPRLESCIWIHAESLGEFKSVVPLLNGLKIAYPNLPILVSTQTKSGFEYASKITQVAYVPWDLPYLVRRAVARINPVIFLSVENSIWPSRFSACAQRQIPVVLVNAKLGLRSFTRYLRFRWLFKNISHALAASNEHAQRFRQLGVKNVHTVKELKLATSSHSCAAS